MTRREAIERINADPGGYLERDGVGKGYVCPICGSGSGKHGTGITSRDGKHFTCWAGRCFTSSTVFDILAVKRGIDPSHMSAEDYALVLGEDVRGSAPSTPPKGNEKPSPPAGEVGSRGSVPGGGLGAEPLTSPYLEACAKRVGETDYFAKRGLSEATIREHGLGYDPAFKTRVGEGFAQWQAAVIPTGEGAYVLRNIHSTGADDRIRKRGPARLFNARALAESEAPVFIVEGEFDALSILEVGGQAVSLGSVANADKLISLLRETPPRAPLILALDNDEPGEKAQQALCEALDALGVPFGAANVAEGYNDPSEALAGDRARFEALVASAQASVAAASERRVREREQAQRAAYIEASSAASHMTGFLTAITDSALSAVAPTGFARLDAALDGGLHDGLYVLGAVSSLGKTTFVLQLSDQVAQGGRDVLIFSLEMARYELMAKSISRLSYQLAREKSNAKTARGISDGKRYGGYGEAERNLIGDAVAAYSLMAERVFIREGMGNIGAAEIRDGVEQHIRHTGNAPLVVVDYLQLLQSADPRMTDKQNIDKSVLELKRISRDFRLPVVAISSFNRENYKQTANMAAFKESGAIEYSSDVLMALQPRGVGEADFDADAARLRDPREVELVVLKNRNGLTGSRIPYDYHPRFNHFVEAPDARRPAPRRV